MTCVAAIVIVTYNSSEFLRELFSSLRAHTDLDHTPVLIVDNASTDATLEILHQIAADLPRMEILAQPRNTGFAGGCNIGIARARALGARYVQLLNPDTVVTAGWMEKVLAVMESRPDVAAAQPLVMLWSEPNRINCAGISIHFCGFPYCHGYRKHSSEVLPKDSVISVSYASGAALLLRLSALDDVGDFDETLFLYLEDCDLQIRLRKAGHQCVLVPAACVYHKYAAEFSASKYSWLERNRWMVLLKDFPLSVLLPSAPALIGVELAVLLFALQRGWLPGKLWAYREFFTHLPQTLAARRQQQNRVNAAYSDAEFIEHLTGRMEFAGMDHPLIKYLGNPLLSAYWKVLVRMLRTRAQKVQRRAPVADTRAAEYSKRLVTLEKAWWKRLPGLDAQAPFRWNLRRLQPGRTLDIGCGLGRNLAHLRGDGVGIDHNPHSIAIARARGFAAFTPEEFFDSAWHKPRSFDSLLLAHTAEHMRFEEALELLQRYLPLLRPNGQVIVITPQEAGYRSDPTHVEFMDFARLEQLLAQAGLHITRRYSFPFPRAAGELFKYNEFVMIGRQPSSIR